MSEENNQEQEQTVEDEVAEEVANADTTDDESGEGAEVKAEEGYVDLTSEEASEEKKFQETMNTAEKIEEPNIDEVVEHKENIETTSEDKDSDEVPEIEPKSEEDKIIPEETANVIKDQELIFVQYVCENPDCMLKFYINKVDDNLGDNLKCYGCKKKLAKKKRLMDVTLKQYKAYTE